MSEAAQTTESLETLIDQAYEVRSEYRDLNDQAEARKKQYKALETAIIALFDDIGLEGGKSHSVSATISEAFQPIIEDYDALKAYVVKNDAWHFLRRQVNVGPYTETVDSGDTVPGVCHDVRRSLSLRRTKG